jgi:hypothetical protein
MTDADIVTKKLALIETYVRELRELANPASIVDDVRERRTSANRRPMDSSSIDWPPTTGFLRNN